MQIKVCGMREPDNIREVAALKIDYMGFIFSEKSPRYVSSDIDFGNCMLSPDAPKRVGVFVDATIDSIVSHAERFRLNYVQLHGNESRDMIAELKKAFVASAMPDVRIIKAISVVDADDVKRWRLYEGIVDMLLFDTKGRVPGGNGKQFDWSILNTYDGDIPFLLSGGIGEGDAQRVLSFKHERMIGVDLNSRFEISPALKDVASLARFINEIRS